MEEDISIIRSKESFEWIFDRLKDLGFSHYVNEKKNTFIMEYGDHVLYADLREEGVISIFIYKKETEKEAAKKNKNSRNYAKYPIGTFKMQDSWKKDLKTKFMSRVEDIIYQQKK